MEFQGYFAKEEDLFIGTQIATIGTEPEHRAARMRIVDSMTQRESRKSVENPVFADQEQGWKEGSASEGEFPSALSTGKPTVDIKEIGRKAVEAAEKEIIQKTLQITRWNRKKAARMLRVSYKALLYKMKRHRLGTTEDV